MFQIVAGIVLQELVEIGDDGAVRQHHFETEHQRARHAVADDAVAAGIGGKISADRTRAARSQIERKEESGFVSGFLNRLQRRAGLDGHGRAGVIDLLDADHALQRNRDPSRLGRGAAAQAGQSALRHERQPCLAAGYDGLRYAGSIQRPNHRDRRLRQARAPVVAIAGGNLSARQHGLRAKPEPQCAEQFFGWFG